MSMLNSGATVAAVIAFWAFLAAVAIAGMVYDYRRRRLAMETLRMAVEHGQHLEPGTLERLLARHHAEEPQQTEDLRPYLHIGAVITIAAGIGVLIAGLWIGQDYPAFRFPIIGIAAIAICVGIGLRISVRVLQRYPPAARPDRPA
jgi:Domain of unknown function (DUF6249)